MNKMMLAVALTIALPGAAFAQAKPAPAPTDTGSMQGMNMSGMNMSGMNMQGMEMQGMQNMSCKDMRAMMAKGHSMHMSQADMAKMCPEPAEAKTSGAHQGNSGQ